MQIRVAGREAGNQMDPIGEVGARELRLKCGGSQIRWEKLRSVSVGSSDDVKSQVAPAMLVLEVVQDLKG